MREEISHIIARRADFEQSLLGSYDPRATTIVLLCYLIAMLSLPITYLGDLVVMGCWVMIGAAMGEVSFGTIFRRVVVILPLLLLIGAFNPIIDRTPIGSIAGLTLTRGWLTFGALLLRGLLAVAAVTVVTEAIGFTALCNALRRLGLPRILTELLLFVYRYLFVIVGEAEDMQRARLARSGGRRGLPLRVWADVTGTLLVRSVDRAERIYGAMLARGYRGRMPERRAQQRWQWRDTLFLFTATLLPVATAIIKPIHQLSV